MATTVLVIEDETQTRSIFLSCLSFEGFAAMGAQGGVEGIRLAQTYTPDLIVCDIMMPDMDGYQVLSTLRQTAATATIPFIFLSAKASMADLRQGMNLGADDYLTKPCTLGQFLAAIEMRLQRQAEFKGAKTPTSRQTAPQDPAVSNIFPTDPLLQPVFDFIETHYQSPIKLQDVAQAAGYSSAYLTSLVHRHTGHSVKQWIIRRRMAQARELLANTTDPIKAIATTIGYTDPAYFVRQFRQQHDISPQVWRTTKKRP